MGGGFGYFDIVGLLDALLNTGVGAVGVFGKGLADGITDTACWVGGVCSGGEDGGLGEYANTVSKSEIYEG